MKFFIKQKVIGFAERYVIENENEEKLYRVFRQAISLKKKWFFVDNTNTQTIQIENIVFTYPAKFKIRLADGNWANVNKKFTWFGDVLEIESSLGNYILTGNKIKKTYEIIRDGELICIIFKKKISIGDIYEVVINDDEEFNLFLAITIVLDAIHER